MGVFCSQIAILISISAIGKYKIHFWIKNPKFGENMTLLTFHVFFHNILRNSFVMNDWHSGQVNKIDTEKKPLISIICISSYWAPAKLLLIHKTVGLRAANSMTLSHAHIYMLIDMSAMLLRHKTVWNDLGPGMPLESHRQTPLR